MYDILSQGTSKELIQNCQKLEIYISQFPYYLIKKTFWKFQLWLLANQTPLEVECCTIPHLKGLTYLWLWAFKWEWAWQDFYIATHRPKNFEKYPFSFCFIITGQTVFSCAHIFIICNCMRFVFALEITFARICWEENEDPNPSGKMTSTDPFSPLSFFPIMISNSDLFLFQTRSNC